MSISTIMFEKKFKSKTTTYLSFIKPIYWIFIITIPYVHCDVTNYSKINFQNGQNMHLLNSDFIQSIDETYWLNKLITILFCYSTILIPIFASVYLIKANLFSEKIQNSPFVKLFVFGKQRISIIDNELEAQLLPNDQENRALSNISKFKSYVQHLKLIYCFFGLQISYLIWGLVQEKIMTTLYQKKYNLFLNNSSQKVPDEYFYFRDSQFLVLVNRALAFCFAIFALFLINIREKFVSKSQPLAVNKKNYLIAPLYEFAFCSLSNILSSWCQYEALKYVNFPTQVLSKACKILAVMAMSQIINKKKYKYIEYFFASSITFGMTFFLFGNQTMQNNYVKKLHLNSDKSEYSHSLLDGLIILMLYITFDAFTSNWQGKMFDKYEITSCQMMAAVNFYSIAFTLVSLTEQGDFLSSLGLVFSCLELTKDCLLLSICSAAGQLFVFYTVSAFGPITFTTIMTLRQSLAILLSCIIYHHPLSFTSLFGILIVFSTLFYQISWKLKNQSLRRPK